MMMITSKILPFFRSSVGKPPYFGKIRSFGSNYNGVIVPGPATVNVSKAEVFAIGFMGMSFCYFIVNVNIYMIPRWRGEPVIH